MATWRPYLNSAQAEKAPLPRPPILNLRVAKFTQINIEKKIKICQKIFM
jgi:hypothetical protein